MMKIAGIVIRALQGAGFDKLSVIDVQALDNKERRYSLELGEKVISEIKLELVCEDGQSDEAVRLIRENARTGQNLAGY